MKRRFLLSLLRQGTILGEFDDAPVRNARPTFRKHRGLFCTEVVNANAAERPLTPSCFSPAQPCALETCAFVMKIIGLEIYYVVR